MDSGNKVLVSGISVGCSKGEPSKMYGSHYHPTKPGDSARGYGTTFRFYDSKIDACRMTWISPLSNTIILFTARKIGDEIVMESTNEAGGVFHWVFSEITPSSFHWRAVGSRDGGKTWITTQEFLVRHVGPPPRKQ
jgi:hypothetical protein